MNLKCYAHVKCIWLALQINNKLCAKLYHTSHDSGPLPQKHNTMC